MTKRDYELLAETIKQFVKDEDDSAVCGATMALVSKLGLALSRDNHRFDQGKFFKACGFDD